MAYESYRWLISGMGSILVYHPIIFFKRWGDGFKIREMKREWDSSLSPNGLHSSPSAPIPPNLIPINFVPSKSID